MTKEDKELLFKDLCGRLPYGVVCEFKRSTLNVLYNKIYDNTLTINNIEYVLKDDSIVRPYLRPMSSMTEEERKELNEVTVINCNEFEGCSTLFDEEGFDWLNAHHFDYRGLIPMGLALEAKEGMYII
jgi:hypothetical protein